MHLHALAGTCVAVAIAVIGCAPEEPAPSPAVTGAAQAWFEIAPLQVRGAHFVDGAGRLRLLRGVGVGGDAKLPPYRPLSDPAQLDRLAELGFDTIRLPFFWEAYEPAPGQYDERYLQGLVEIAAAAQQRGLWTILDVHQDGFSRHLLGGCGSGFPAWAIPDGVRPVMPRNDERCAGWLWSLGLDLDVRRAFAGFFANRGGVRDAFLGALERVADALSAQPGLLGYDLLNEPWGSEPDAILPLYEDAAARVLGRDPDAILFVQPAVMRSPAASQTELPRPRHESVVFAPHLYDPGIMLAHRWLSGDFFTDRAIAQLDRHRTRWNAPVFIGEFGVPAPVARGDEYLDRLYQRMDRHFFSGAQWNYTPHWTPQRKDGWNREDFSIVDDRGQLRANHVARPRWLAVAGQPLGFEVGGGAVYGAPWQLVFSWAHEAALGETVVYLPVPVDRPTADLLDIEPAEAACAVENAARHAVLSCRAPRDGPVTVSLLLPSAGASD
jgi:endoglycosylceramidase